MSDNKNNSTFLDIDDSILKNKLILDGNDSKELESLFPEPSLQRAAVIKPKVGLCVKTKDENKKKVFLNVCTSDAIPTPEDISDQELISILESEETSDFRVPMSIGQPHYEKDKSGETCVAYDVVISPQFFTKMTNNPLFSNFFMIATLEGIEDKYDLKLDKNGWTVLKNKKYHGNMPEQAVRTTVPLVQELSGVRHWNKDDLTNPSGDTSNKPSSANSPLITEVSTRITEKIKPSFSLKKINSSTGQTLLARIQLPEIVSSQSIDVKIGEDRITVETQKNLLDVFVSFSVDNSRADAHFVTSLKVLVVRVPILS